MSVQNVQPPLWLLKLILQLKSIATQCWRVGESARMVLASKNVEQPQGGDSVPLDLLKRAQEAVEMAEKRSTRNTGLRELKVSTPEGSIYRRD